METRIDVCDGCNKVRRVWRHYIPTRLIYRSWCNECWHTYQQLVKAGGK